MTSNGHLQQSNLPSQPIPTSLSVQDRALNSSDYKHAIAIDTQGLPVFSPQPIRLYVNPIVYSDKGRPLFYCRQCSRRLPYIAFEPKDLCISKTARCYNCKAKGRPQNGVYRPAFKRVGLDGTLRFFCRICGYYVPAELMNDSRKITRRAICQLCHRREFVINKRDKYRHVRNRFSKKRLTLFCLKCGFNSRRRICMACALGAPRIAASHLLRNTGLNNTNALVALLKTCKKQRKKRQGQEKNP